MRNRVLRRTDSNSTDLVGIARRRKRFRIGLMPTIPAVVLLITLAGAVLAPWLAPYDPVHTSLRDSMLPPAWADGGSMSHPLGTDVFGRDQISRLLYGARVSLSASFLVLGLATSVGVVLGLISGYFGKFWDILIMRVVDLFLAVPALLIAIVMAVIFGPSFLNVVIIIALFYWTIIARQVRGEVLSIREQDYVILARTAGASNLRIMFKHILPNVFPTIVVITTLQIGTVILFESSLSFLGVGIPPPNPSWGVMVSDGRGELVTGWWISFFPGLSIMLVVLASNSFGDWLRDRLDPRLRTL